MHQQQTCTSEHRLGAVANGESALVQIQRATFREHIARTGPFECDNTEAAAHVGDRHE